MENEDIDLIRNTEDLDQMLKLIINQVSVSDLNQTINKANIKVLLRSARHTKDQNILSFIDTLREKYFCTYCLQETPILSLKCEHHYCYFCCLELLKSVKTENLNKFPKKITCHLGCTKKSSIGSLKPLLSHPAFIETADYPKLFFLVNNQIKPPPALFNTPDPKIPCSLCQNSFPLHQLYYPCLENPYCKPCLFVPLSKMTCSICNSAISIEKISDLLNN